MVAPNAEQALRPKTWAEYIGQEHMKARLRLHIDAAKRDCRMIQHVLLAGPPGFGKTSLAELIAIEMLAQTFVKITMPINRVKLAEAILYSEPCSVILIDEVHRLPRAAQEDLLNPIEDGYFQREWGHEHIEHPLTIIAATTEEHAVIKPLRDRFHIRPPFDDYTPEEMTRIVKQMGNKIGVHLTDEVAAIYGRASTGVPRLAKSIVLTAGDCPDPLDAEFVLTAMGINEDGLTIIHMRYLNTLRDSSKGAAGVKTLAASCGIPEDMVFETEEILVNLRYVERTASGRKLLPKGYKFINAHKKAASEQQNQEVNA